MGNQLEIKDQPFPMPGIEEAQQRISHCFTRSEVKRNSQLYLGSLISQVARRNCWQLAEVTQQKNPYGMQRLLCEARWDADVVRDDLRGYVMAYLEDSEAIGVLDETGFIKKGNKSAGVSRQYSGTAGKIENCQIGVFLVYASSKGTAFLDRELYLPQEWTNNPPRCKEAGIPRKVRFATKVELAKRMLTRAKQAGVVFSWVTGDEIYGSQWGLRHWLEDEEQPYVLAVRSNQYVWWNDLRQWQVKRLVREITGDTWKRLSIGNGSKGLRIYDWARIKLPDFGQVLPAGWGKWLLVRRNVDKPEEMAYFLAAGPEDIALDRLAQVAGKRWAIEMAFEEAKGEAGLDEYEVRKWESWYRHVTLSLMAHAYLVVCRAYGKKGAVKS